MVLQSCLSKWHQSQQVQSQARVSPGEPIPLAGILSSIFHKLVLSY